MRNYNILIVDDIVECIQTITGFLEESHPEYRLFQATSGRSAMHSIELTTFDLILCDWDMPGMTGIELLAHLQSGEKTQHIPVIIVTGVMMNPKDLDNALEAGAHDYIRKPVDPVELSARVNSALKFVSCHHQEIERKNLELVEKTLMLIKNHEYFLELEKKIHNLEKISGQIREARSIVNEINHELEQKIREDSWQHFDIAFQNVHPEFSKKLATRYTNLTPGEMRLCILLKLGINNKDMSTILFQSPASLRVARSRLRKKLQIGDKVNVQSFLVAI